MKIFFFRQNDGSFDTPYWIIAGVQKIDSLTLTVPADGIEWIGIGAHSVNEEASSVKDEEDPERRSISQQMKLLWKELTEKLENDITTLGLCDLETDVFFNLFNEAAIKPSNFQVNYKFNLCRSQFCMKNTKNTSFKKMRKHMFRFSYSHL